MTLTPKQCLIILLKEASAFLCNGSNTVISSRQVDDFFKINFLWNKLGSITQNSLFFKNFLSVKTRFHVFHELLDALEKTETIFFFQLNSILSTPIILQKH